MQYRIRLYWPEIEEWVDVDETYTEERAGWSSEYYKNKYPHLSGHVFDCDAREEGVLGTGKFVEEWGEYKASKND